MPKVLIATRTFGKYSQEPLELLRKYSFEILIYEKEVLPETLGDVDALIVGTPKVTRDILANSNLKIIAKHGVGVDNIDLKAATELGIPVTVTPGANTESVAELTIGLIFVLARNIVSTHIELFQEHSWHGNVGIEIYGKVLGLVGFGAIAREVNKRAACLGMKVIAYDPYVPAKEIQNAGAKPAILEEVLQLSDFVSIHVPLTEETKGLIGEKELRQMKRSAFLINTARGGIVDEEALATALKEGWISGAALDVFSQEPPNFDSPLFGCNNLVTTPHMGAHTIEAVYRMNIMAAQAVIDFFQGRIPKHVVNQEVLSKLLKAKGSSL
ncbi:MAG: phosphoglycerate dehydrogenase [bacterium]|nr:phosphoglycerate dehydrogenase [bacterium]